MNANQTAKKKYKYVIGIDPGTHTGLAVYDTEEGKLIEVSTLKIFDAFIRIYFYRIFGDILLRVENPNTWKPFRQKDHYSKIQGAGSIKRDFAIWKSFADENHIDFEGVSLQSTLKKLNATTFKQLTKWEGKTSTHARDAAMLCFGY